jgi:hypothetical protein
VQSICDYLAAPGGTVEIHDNAAGCNSQVEVADDCGITTCLSEGITFTTQAQVDSFQVNYFGCRYIKGDVSVSGSDISNLQILNVVISIGGKLSIHDNNILTSLSGLENINAGSIAGIQITNNPSLSTCNVQSICDYLAAPNAIVDIHDNATGCNSQEEVLQACIFGLSENNPSVNYLHIYPNPTATQFNITFTLEHSSKVMFEVYNRLGQEVAAIVNENMTQGEHMVRWNIAGLSPGIYFYRFTADHRSSTGKLVVVK